MKYGIFFSKIFCLAACVISFGCEEEKPKTTRGRPPVPVVVTQAKKRDLKVTLNSIGRCRAHNEVDRVSEVSGEIIAIHFEEGSFVEKGQILFQIDDRKYQANLKSAEAELARSEAQLSIDQVQLERSRSLVTKDYISKQEFDTYAAKVEQDQAVIAAAKAAIHRAQIDLEHCVIRAPFSGLVGQRLVDQGAVVNVMQKLVSIRQITPLSVDFFVSENDFPELKRCFEANGQQLNFEVTMVSDDRIREKGVLKFLDNHIDSDSGVIHLKGEIENQEHHFWPGCTVHLEVELNILKNVVTVPSESIRQNSDGKSFLYITQENLVPESVAKLKAHQILPEFGHQGKDFSEVKQGVREGDTVILRGNMFLGEGSDLIPAPETQQ